MTKFDPKKEKKRLKKWLEAKWFFESTVKRLEEELAYELSPGLTVGIDKLSSWFGNLGNYEVLQSDSAGWRNIRRSIEYGSLGIRINSVFQDLATRGTRQAGDSAISLSSALAFRQDRYATWLGDRILDSLKANERKYEFGPPADYNRAFLQFYALFRRRKFDVKDYTSESLGVYQAVLDGWQNEKAYLKACLQACDYHVERMHEEEGFSEFLGAPENLLPVEILMIRRIRDDLGLPNPEIDHPLMQTPLGHPPKQLPEIKDNLLDKVTAKAKADLEHFPVF
jgi:hypothetical protein